MRTRNTAAARTMMFWLAIVGLLFLLSCKQPESTKTEPPPAGGSPKQSAEEMQPGTLVELNGQTYREVDCDCSDEPEKNVDLDTFFTDALSAPDMKKFIADHMKDVKPLCLKAKNKQSVHWQTKKYKFQVMKFVNYADDKDADLFESKPPFPATQGHDGKSGPMKADAPSPSTPGKCFVFKGYFRVTKENGDLVDIDPHIGTGCCK